MQKKRQTPLARQISIPQLRWNSHPASDTMLITIQFNRDSRIEVELTPDPIETDTAWCDHWLVARLKVLPSGRIVRLDGGGGSCNTAALYHIFQLFRNQCERNRRGEPPAKDTMPAGLSLAMSRQLYLPQPTQLA